VGSLDTWCDFFSRQAFRPDLDPQLAQAAKYSAKRRNQTDVGGVPYVKLLEKLNGDDRRIAFEFA